MIEQSLAVAGETRAALVDAGGRFMTGDEMAVAAQPLGIPAGGLYFRGRAGAVGDVSPVAATSLIGLFPSWVIEATWRQSADLPGHVAVDAYSSACAQWGRNHLSRLVDAGRLHALGERVIDAAEASALALFAAWRSQPRPNDDAARAAFTLMLLRELRGGLHFAALRAQGLDVPVAVLADPGGGEARLRRTAWREDEIAALKARADRVPDLRARWDAAEQWTNSAFAGHLDVLAAGELSELANHIRDAEVASRPPE